VPFTVTSIGSVGNTVALSVYSVDMLATPGANRLILLGVSVADTAGTPVQPSSVSGGGLVFSMIGSSITWGPLGVGNQVYNLSLWRSMGASPDGSLISIAFANAATGCAAIVDEVTGINTSGTSGANAVGHSSITASDNSLGIDVIAAQEAAAASNAWYTVAAHGGAQAMTASNDFTLVSGVSHVNPGNRFQSAWTTLSTGTALRWASTTNFDRAGIILELVAAPSGPSPYYSHYYRRIVGGE
jgi:hypothetical protein